MWFWLISAIASSILGNAANSWFADTKCGIWFYKKIDDISNWSAKKLNIKVLEKEEAWKKKYPNVTKKMNDLEHRIKNLEQINLFKMDDNK
tara:strand:- start:315 stop:587 length:273 start_codon:yes stop_codon:yes gene_type:complete